MAHSPDRRRTVKLISTTALATAIGLIAIPAFPVGPAAAKDPAKASDSKAPAKPVGVASTVPTKGPVAVGTSDGSDGVDRDEENGIFLGGPGWVCPVPTSTFRNDWGNPRSGGRSHEGTDMFAAMGTPILAPVSGTVKRHESGRAGLSFYLQGSDGVQYFGAHLAALVKTGEVRAGDVIAQVGDSGNARGGTPHLHFEIHPTRKTKTNPYPTLAQQCAGVATVK
jgi:murein DD-endopeptidase MepM/ murein hydrolase activator NlpD